MHMIEDSKVFLTNILDKIREQGHISIQRDINSSDSSKNDSGLSYTMNPPNYSKESFYPKENIDEKFDLQHRQSVLKKDDVLDKEIKKSIQELEKYATMQYSPWKRSDQLNSMGYIGPVISRFQHIYDELEYTPELDKNFINNMDASLFVVNGNIINLHNNQKKILNDFKNLIPDIHFQKLISAYSNRNILSEAYANLEQEYPDLNKYRFCRSRNAYKIDNLDDGTVKIVITNTANLEPQQDNLSTQYNFCGMRATIIASPYKAPIIKYSYFLK